ncbi:hypothetical protein IEE92_02230 [Kocuria sp. cx-116]|uniref:hypothetical protein n=1 Tax=Kocuria sp. cx-116 TaxID=2771378 RepID=UPI001687533F|nr:hypothetical protein [Kocuria sp. cx-116]MBD2761378.1 hypothetical protein [Kocuria sp. cx-116]
MDAVEKYQQPAISTGVPVLDQSGGQLHSCHEVPRTRFRLVHKVRQPCLRSPSLWWQNPLTHVVCR